MPKFIYVERSGGQIPLHSLGQTQYYHITETLSNRGKADGATSILTSTGNKYPVEVRSGIIHMGVTAHWVAG